MADVKEKKEKKVTALALHAALQRQLRHLTRHTADAHAAIALAPASQLLKLHFKPAWYC
jgi:hypothetical protein